MSTIYTARATATGSGRDGHVTSDDGLLDVDLAVPKEMGGRGGAANPEILFAGGYAACFHSALLHSARAAKQKVGETSVSATVGIGPNGDDGFALTVALHVSIDGLDADAAQDLVQRAHGVCPYSNAIKGNIDVTFDVITPSETTAA